VNAAHTTITEPDLVDWLTLNAGDPILNDEQAATDLVASFDLLDKTSRSLNNRHQIATCIYDARDDNDPMWPRTVRAEAAAAALYARYRITPKPTDRPTVLLPAPVVVSRHQCPFCRRYTRADARQVLDHMTRCFNNPGLRCCKTCTHHQDASGAPGSPDEWLEACTHDDGPEHEEYRFPVLHCPLWQPKEN
jgi:hypothetical protein